MPSKKVILPEPENLEGLEEPDVEPEDKQDEPIQKPPQTPPPPEINLSKIKEEIQSDVIDKLVSSLKPMLGTDVDTPPWEKENRNPQSYKELTDYVDTLAQKREKQRLEETEKTQNEQKKQQDEYNVAMNQYWDNQLEDLRIQDKLPKIQNKEDPNDPGIIAQKQIFSQMVELNQKIVSEGKPAITNVKEFFYEHYKNPFKQPAGGDAPIAGGRTLAESPQKEGEYSYDEIHNARNVESLLTP